MPAILQPGCACAPCRLERETAARQKLSQAHGELEVLVSKLSERNSKLGTDLHSRETEASVAQGAAGSNAAGSCLPQAD